MRKRTFLFTICALAMIINGHFSPGLKAQQQQQQKSQDGSGPNRVLTVQPPVLAPAGTLISPTMRMPANLMATIADRNFERTLVKGAPFSAESVMESIQVLTDGNRIVNTTSSSLYRDSEGRTRVERSMLQPGMRVENTDLYKSIRISDPVGKQNYVLQPRSQTAMKTPYFEFKVSLNNPGVQSSKEHSAIIAARILAQQNAAASASKTRGSGQQAIPADRNTFGIASDPSGNVQARTVQVAPLISVFPGAQNGEGEGEPLGKQMIEGVEAVGTRTTQTIPAGIIGNERPIEIVNERWYSPELQVIILAKQIDPRSGETVYRLTNINRSEPDTSLFQVPSNYTIQEPPKFEAPAIGAPVRRKNDDQ